VTTEIWIVGFMAAGIFGGACGSSNGGGEGGGGHPMAGAAGTAGAGGSAAGSGGSSCSGGASSGMITGRSTVGASTYHSCAVLAGGSVRCWGYNYDGELGDGTGTNSLVPVAVAGLSDAITVSVSAYHACALRAGGEVACWGANGSGELGSGSTTTYSLVPAAVSGLTDATAISGGTSFGSTHTCAVRIDGTVQCWGLNASGELGNGSTTDATAMFSLVPVAVSGLTGATAIATGSAHTCALAGDGAIWCWGGNSNGQLGNGSTTGSRVPVPVSSPCGATAISAGGSHACALLKDGTVWCWGYDGYSDVSGSDTFPPVAVGGLAGVTAIAAGINHNCALLAGGTVACWGHNRDGQLGNGSNSDSFVPVAVNGLTGVTEVSAGGDFGRWGGSDMERIHGASCAKLATGAVECWGYNWYGALGSGSMTSSSVPVPVVALP